MTQEISPPYLREELRKLHYRIQDLERNVVYTTQAPIVTGFNTPAFVAPVIAPTNNPVGPSGVPVAPPVVPPATTDEVLSIHITGVLIAGDGSGVYIPAVNGHLRTITATVVTPAATESVVDIQINDAINIPIASNVNFPGNTFDFTPGTKTQMWTVDVTCTPGVDYFRVKNIVCDGTIADIVVTLRFTAL